jgi:hypothetical protein
LASANKEPIAAPTLSAEEIKRTHLAIALGRAAVEAGYPVLFTTATALLADLVDCRQKGILSGRMSAPSQPHVHGSGRELSIAAEAQGRPASPRAADDGGVMPELYVQCVWPMATTRLLSAAPVLKVANAARSIEWYRRCLASGRMSLRRNRRL